LTCAITPAKPSSRSSIRPLPFASFHTFPLKDTDFASEDCVCDKVGVNEGYRLSVPTIESLASTSFDTRMPSTVTDHVDVSKSNCVNSDSKESFLSTLDLFPTSAVVATSFFFFSILRFIVVASSDAITAADEMQIVIDRSRRQRSIVVELFIFKLFVGISSPL
jgi:hypothetical protein